MATGTFFSKAMMEAIRDGGIVDARLDGTDLVLVRYDESEVNVGNVQGPKGDDGTFPTGGFNFDTMPSVGGNALFSVASNTNGAFIKFAGLFQMCMGYISSIAQNSYKTWTFPSAFASTTNLFVGGTAEGASSSIQNIEVDGITTTEAKVYSIRTNTNTTNVRVFAIGLLA